jgi:predicted transcriptional regulator
MNIQNVLSTFEPIEYVYAKEAKSIYDSMIQKAEEKRLIEGIKQLKARKIKTDRPINDICTDPDIPSFNYIRKFVSKNKEAKELYDSIPRSTTKKRNRLLNSKTLRNDRKKVLKSRRVVLPGYPKTEPFKSIEEVERYLSTPKIVCLLCGKEYKSIGNHLKNIHGIELNDYRKMFDIPRNYGLCCPETKQAHKKATEKRMSEGFKAIVKKGIRGFIRLNDLQVLPKKTL